MTLPGLEAVAQVAVGRVLNSLPESLLIVLSAGLLLRLIGRRNSGTRFAVWMIAFLAVAVLPFLDLDNPATGAGLAAVPPLHPALTIPTVWAEIFLFAWVPLALLALLRVASGLARVRRIRSTAVEVDLSQADPILRATLEQHSAGRSVCLATSDQVRVPTAIGFRRPAVVLPPWVLRELPAEQLRPILIHELTHLARRDDWTNLLQKAIRAVFCFHPALWWIDSRLSRERELACDDAVLVATADPRAYASSLLGLLERSGLRRGWSMAQAAIGRAREATQRITRILTGGRPATTRVSRSALGLAATVSAACCGLLLATPQLVVFGPEQPVLPAHAQAAPRLLPDVAEPVAAESAAPTPRVVTAAWHPDSAPSAVAPAHTPARPHRKPAPRLASAPAPVLAATREPVTRSAAVPAVTLASAPDHAAAPVFLLFETTETRVVPAPAPASAAAANLPAQKQPAPATRIETVQFLEQRDASGAVHIQIIRLLLVSPGGTLPESLSQAI